MRGAALALVIAAAACNGSSTATTGGPAPPHHTLSNAGETWCPEGFEQGPNDTCFAIPEKPSKDTPVLVYLHGMYQGHGVAEEWAAVQAATQKGYAVFIPRGKRGLCPGKAEFKDYYCWPQDPDDTDAVVLRKGQDIAHRHAMPRFDAALGVDAQMPFFDHLGGQVA